MKENGTGFKEGHKLSEKWTKETAEAEFNEIMNHALHDNNVMSIQQAHIDRGMSHTTFYYLIRRFPNLNNIKKDIGAILISRINKLGLKNDVNPTMSIWRMKQLGERDQQYLDQKTENYNYNASVSREEAREISKSLEEDY